MAARLRQYHQQEIREKIRASQLVNALENHVLKGKNMKTTQVTAALGLLRKCVADISYAEIAGVNGGPVQFQEVTDELEIARRIAYCLNEADQAIKKAKEPEHAPS